MCVPHFRWRVSLQCGQGLHPAPAHQAQLTQGKDAMHSPSVLPLCSVGWSTIASQPCCSAPCTAQHLLLCCFLGYRASLLKCHVQRSQVQCQCHMCQLHLCMRQQHNSWDSDSICCKVCCAACDSNSCKCLLITTQQCLMHWLHLPSCYIEVRAIWAVQYDTRLLATITL